MSHVRLRASTTRQPVNRRNRIAGWRKAGSSKSNAAKSPSSKKPDRAFCTFGRSIFGALARMPFLTANENPRRNADSSLFTVCRAAPAASRAFAYSSNRVGVIAVTGVGA